MAYYDALIAEWPTVIAALPAGTTQQMLDYLNALTVTGSPPTMFSVTAADLFSAFDAGEWMGLVGATDAATVIKVGILRDILRLPGPIPVGAGTTASNFLFNFFALSPATLLGLAKLAVSQVQPWWQANGYPRAFDLGDIAAAGLS